MTRSKNLRTVWMLVGALVAMIGLAYASVPLYRAFCSATGFNGEARRAREAPRYAVNKVMRVHFDVNTRNLPWTFKPAVPYLDTQVGKTKLVTFSVTNTADHPVTGRASFNVLPDTMGAYFMKLQCFCFQDQTLKPGESRDFQVVYFLDPRLVRDQDTKTVSDVTLSYTFYESKSDGKSGT
jgi:cytochrome c oxidase assembly protein subunit 11